MALIRLCLVCRQADDHPRHTINVTSPDTAPHMDCCSSVGCPDGSCDILTRDKGKKVGDGFRSQIVDDDFAAETLDLLDKRDAPTAHFTADDLDPGTFGVILAATELKGADR